jgi:ribosomal protein L24E
MTNRQLALSTMASLVVVAPALISPGIESAASASTETLRLGVTEEPASFTEWGPARSLSTIYGTHPDVNTSYNDGCPAVSRDGLSLYMASNRPGSLINPATGVEGQDIWVSHRDSTDDPWGEPVHLLPPINSPQNDFCPTPLRNGHGLLFVSERPGYCGGSDIFVAREHPQDGSTDLVHLGCVINSAAGEASPFVVDYDDGHGELYFSSNRPGGAFLEGSGQAPDSDIYVSALYSDGSMGVPHPAPGVNTPWDDSRPNVRRDGLEMFFDSTRPGSILGANQLPSVDIWTATRESATDPWSEPAHLEGNINSAFTETRAFLSWDGTTLYFGSTRVPGEGMTDIHLTTREKVTGDGARR